MILRLIVSEWDGVWSAYIEEIGISSGRKHAPRKVVWSGRWPGMPPLDFLSHLDVLEAVLEEARPPRSVLPRGAGSASPGGS
jgi:hypothetical protein